MSRSDGEITLLDQAARAGWLYYVGGMTQDEIAAELGVSRQRAQRLVSRASVEGLVHVRLNHKIAACLQLETALLRRYGLGLCRVAPSLGAGADPNRTLAPTAADVIETFLRRPDPLVIAVGTGRALRSAVDELLPVEALQHRIVSLIGNIAPDGSASLFDVIMRIAEKVNAPHYPMPLPVVADTPEERTLFRSLHTVKKVVDLAQRADVSFVGVGQMNDDAPLLKDGFLTHRELRELQDRGAAGEICGGIYDSEGRYIESRISARISGIRVEAGSPRPVIAIAAGPVKVGPISAAIQGSIINGLVTDELTASALLAL